MTEAEFIQIHNPTVAGNINFSLQINVNIQNQIPQLGFSSQQAREFITGITVTSNAKYVDENYDVNITPVLQQVEKIRFTFNEKQYSLVVVNRSFYANNDPVVTGTVDSVTGFSMFYFKVVPFLMPIIYTNAQLPRSEEDVLINFTPFITDLQFALNDYNTLINNATNIRVSEIIVESNRTQGQTIPDNFGPIYTGSAQKAAVQDSNYSSIGWKNSRYDGAKSIPNNYAGVSPSITGLAFTGEVLPEDALDDVVCLTPSDSRIYEELFHTGETTLPTFVTSSIGPALGTTLSSTDSILLLETSQPITGSIDAGDILIIENEKMRVLDFSPNLDPPRVRVKRGHASSGTSIHNSGTSINKVDRVDLFRFGSSDTRISSAVKSIIYIKDSNQALYTDEFGTVFTGSQCPPT